MYVYVDRFWQQLRTDIREGLQAAEAFCSERGWMESSSSYSYSRCKTSDVTRQKGRTPDEKEGGKDEASYPVVAGMLLDFIEVGDISHLHHRRLFSLLQSSQYLSYYSRHTNVCIHTFMHIYEGYGPATHRETARKNCTHISLSISLSL